MFILDPKAYSTTAAELQRFSSVFNMNCEPHYLGWNLRAGFRFRDIRPQRYLDVYLALGQYLHTTHPVSPTHPVTLGSHTHPVTLRSPGEYSLSRRFAIFDPPPPPITDPLNPNSQISNPGLRLSYPTWVPDVPLFIQACNRYGALAWPITNVIAGEEPPIQSGKQPPSLRAKRGNLQKAIPHLPTADCRLPTSFSNAPALDPQREILAYVGFYLGLTESYIHPFEQRTVAEIHASTKALLRDYDYI